MVESFKMNCFPLNRSIRVTIHLPEQYYNSNRYFSSVFFLDGQNLYDDSESYTGKAVHLEPLITKLDEMEKEAIYIGIWAAKEENRRKAEYVTDELAEFIIKQMVPFLSDRYRLNHFKYILGTKNSCYTALRLCEAELFKGCILMNPELLESQIDQISFPLDKLYYIVTSSNNIVCETIKQKASITEIIIQESKTDEQKNLFDALNYLVL